MYIAVRIISLLLFHALCVRLSAAETSAAASPRWWLKDAGAAIAAPLHWEAADFGKLGLVSAAVGVSYAWLDGIQQDRTYEKRRNGIDDISKGVSYMWDGTLLVPLFGGAYLYGASSDNGGLKNAALTGLESYLVSGALVDFAKLAVHRPRPKTGASRSELSEQKFFSGSNLSFPSGHSASAFSSARVAAWYFKDSPAAPYISYGLATLVAWSRVNDMQHWPSDVVAGSAAGYFVAGKIISMNESRTGGTVQTAAILPFCGDQAGLTAYYRF